MKSQIIDVTAPLHVFGASVRGDKDVAQTIDIVQTVGNSPINIMSQQAVSRAISQGIVFETYNRKEIDDKDLATLALAVRQHAESLQEYDKQIRLYINEEDVRFLDEYRQYAHSQDVYYKDLTLKEANEYTDEVVKNVRLFNIKGRVDSKKDLPHTGNQPFDMYLVGPEGSTDFVEYYWLTSHEPHKWEQLGVVSSDIPLDEYYKKSELDPKLLIIDTNISLLQSGKVDKVTGKQLSTEDFTTEFKTRLAAFTLSDIEEMLKVNASEARRIEAETLRVQAEIQRENNKVATIDATNKANTAATEANTAAKAATSAATAANTAAIRSNTLSDNLPKVIDGEWWFYNESTKVYENSNLTASGNVQYATFEVDLSDGGLYMRYDPVNYKGAGFVIEDGILKTVL